jgi:hypothetical protein
MGKKVARGAPFHYLIRQIQKPFEARYNFALWGSTETIITPESIVSSGERTGFIELTANMPRPAETYARLRKLHMSIDATLEDNRVIAVRYDSLGGHERLSGINANYHYPSAKEQGEPLPQKRQAFLECVLARISADLMQQDLGEYISLPLGITNPRGPYDIGYQIRRSITIKPEDVKEEREVRLTIQGPSVILTPM